MSFCLWQWHPLRGKLAQLADECAGEDAAACLRVGQVNILEEYENRSEDRALDYLNEACNLGLAEGCAAIDDLVPPEPVEIIKPPQQ